MEKIIVIGAGPKFFALATKAYVLKKLGYSVPEIIAIEKNEIAAHWTGKYGFTDGKCLLGVSPLKDVGYPYDSFFGKKVDQEMENFSFIQHLKELGRFTAWVDGNYSPITHFEFAHYFQWIAQKINPKIIKGEVVHLSHGKNQWQIMYKVLSVEKKMKADGIVVTGPGDYKGNFKLSKDFKNIYTGKTFWMHSSEFQNLRNSKIALIGGGTTGGSIFEKLMPLLGEGSNLDWFTRRGIFTRSENFSNNQLFSHPESWNDFEIENRKNFIKHTDSGTVEQSVHQVLVRHYGRYQIRIGEPQEIKEGLQAELCFKTASGIFKEKYDKIILATGFDNLHFLKWLPGSILRQIPTHFRKEEDIAQILLPDLSIEGVLPKLHVPLLAWLKYGVSVGELSCLSTFSDRILSSYMAQGCSFYPISDAALPKTKNPLNLVYVTSFRNAASDKYGQYLNNDRLKYMMSPLEFLENALKGSLKNKFILKGVIYDDDETNKKDLEKLGDYLKQMHSKKIGRKLYNVPSNYRKISMLEEKKRIRGKKKFEESLLKKLLELKADVVLFEGFLILVNDLISPKSPFHGKILNIHPGITRLDSPHQRRGISPTLDALKGASNKKPVFYTGASMHFVNENVDGGAVICDALKTKIDPNETVEELRFRNFKESLFPTLEEGLHYLHSSLLAHTLTAPHFPSRGE